MQTWTEWELSKGLLGQEEDKILPSLLENEPGGHILLQPLTKGRNTVLL